MLSRIEKGIIEQLMFSLGEMPDTYEVEKLSEAKYKVTVLDPVIVGEGADEDLDDEDEDETEDTEEQHQEFIVELKVTKV